MISRRIFAAMAVCLFLSSSAFAGHGGTKKDSTVRVRNDSNTPIAAFIDPNPAVIAGLGSSPTQAQIEAAGGKLINSGQTADFKVKSGSFTLAAGSNPSTAASTTVNVPRGSTKSFSFNGSTLTAL